MNFGRAENCRKLLGRLFRSSGPGKHQTIVDAARLVGRIFFNALPVTILGVAQSARQLVGESCIAVGGGRTVSCTDVLLPGFNGLGILLQLGVDDAESEKRWFM